MRLTPHLASPSEIRGAVCVDGLAMLVRVGFVGAVLSILSAAASADPSVVVHGVTINGAISNLNPDVANYFGIPYASAARWLPPKTHASLPNPFDASDF